MTDEPATPPSATPSTRRRRPARVDPPATQEPEQGQAGEPQDALRAAATAPLEPAATLPAEPADWAPAVEVARGAVGGIRARDVHVRTGVVGGIAGDHASIEMGIVGVMAAREASVSQGIVRAVVAQDVRIEQSFVRSIAANRVHTGPTTAIAFVVARQVDGNARILFDWRGALALAGVLGALAAVLRLLRR